MNQCLLVFIGAGLGGVLRYLIAHGLNLLTGHHFPYGTILVNVTGCFLAGFLSICILPGDVELKALILIGFLGGYTTFSSFSYETWQLLEKRQLLAALLNVVLSVMLCMVAVVLGVCLGSTFHSKQTTIAQTSSSLNHDLKP